MFVGIIVNVMKIVDYPSVINPEKEIDWITVEQMTESAKKIRETYGIVSLVVSSDGEVKPLKIEKNKRDGKDKA